MKLLPGSDQSNASVLVFQRFGIGSEHFLNLKYALSDPASTQTHDFREILIKNMCKSMFSKRLMGLGSAIARFGAVPHMQWRVIQARGGHGGGAMRAKTLNN